ncbi:hypothetical protein [Arthrobacter sp. FB24]|uniref:hypothetical protein n=1 Tax=Arthrobacter sp. (strain FB24) TaxID=290399 RepID=UPI0018DEA23A|nr:hypothetical protein [Arthrobacter sp. FB24]
MEKRRATYLTNRQAGLQEVNPGRHRGIEADRNVQTFPGEDMFDWLASTGPAPRTRCSPR